MLSVASTSPTAATSQNVFVAIASDAPPQQISSRSDHPVPQLGIIKQNGAYETNKFYANFFLGEQNNAVWTHPYSVAWSRGGGTASSWGLAISHIERSQLAWASGKPPEYFINPICIQSVIISAAELGSSTNLTTDTLKGFSVNINLVPSPGESPLISFPLVQGMGYITGLYNGATILLQSGVTFTKLTFVGLTENGSNTYKYRIVLADTTNWLIYITPTGAAGAPPLRLTSDTTITGPSGFHGTVQVAKNPMNTTGEQIYDASAGVYPTSASISGSVKGNTGMYTISWQKAGQSNQTLLMFALPHHMESLSSVTSGCVTDLKLETTTKGMATAIVTDELTCVEDNLPTGIGFNPWSPSATNVTSLPSTAVDAINRAAVYELSEDMTSQTDLNSMYYSGKALAKFATIVYTTQVLGLNTSLAAVGLQKLETAYATFINNQQICPLVYDTVWGGAVSSATYVTGNSGDDFGNTYYNDHHFHYGYFVQAAAIIAYLDPSWLSSGTNKAYVDMLIRDFANPVDDDPYFPFQRSFDWYHGHSWAKGLFDSGDGKDQESSSEDTLGIYAIKMWGQVTGDPNMEARGNLQLAVQARSLQNYFLLQDNNTVQPPQFVPNKVTGILFENKVDHTTYFGTNIEYIEGIHMIPLNPASAFTRTQSFVTEEWNQYFAPNNYAADVTGGWQGILYANLAIIDAKTSYNFFANPNFDYGSLDGGASRTWYLAYAAGLGGV
jgi:endo-1,3(4)-beta-glucanase